MYLLEEGPNGNKRKQPELNDAKGTYWWQLVSKSLFKEDNSFGEPIFLEALCKAKTRSIFKKDNCRRLQSCGVFKYKKYSFQCLNFLLLRSMVRPISQRSKVGRKFPQELTQVSPRSHPRHLVGKKTAQRDTTKTSLATARWTAISHKVITGLLNTEQIFYKILIIFRSHHHTCQPFGTNKCNHEAKKS